MQNEKDLPITTFLLQSFLFPMHWSGGKQSAEKSGRGRVKMHPPTFHLCSAIIPYCILEANMGLGIPCLLPVVMSQSPCDCEKCKFCTNYHTTCRILHTEAMSPLISPPPSRLACQQMNATGSVLSGLEVKAREGTPESPGMPHKIHSFCLGTDQARRNM